MVKDTLVLVQRAWSYRETDRVKVSTSTSHAGMSTGELVTVCSQQKNLIKILQKNRSDLTSKILQDYQTHFLARS